MSTEQKHTWCVKQSHRKSWRHVSHPTSILLYTCATSPAFYSLQWHAHVSKTSGHNKCENGFAQLGRNQCTAISCLFSLLARHLVLSMHSHSTPAHLISWQRYLCSWGRLQSPAAECHQSTCPCAAAPLEHSWFGLRFPATHHWTGSRTCQREHSTAVLAMLMTLCL